MTGSDAGDDLHPEMEAGLGKQVREIHEDLLAGRMCLMYRMRQGARHWLPPVVWRWLPRRFLRMIPIVAVPHCFETDCRVVKAAGVPVWPAVCACKRDKRDSARDWRSGCPAHGEGSDWLSHILGKDR